MTDKLSEEKLQALFVLDPIVRALYGHFAHRKNAIRETTAGDLVKIANCPWDQAVRALKRISQAGGGTFRKGRARRDGVSNESRIKWDLGDPREQARAFCGTDILSDLAVAATTAVDNRLSVFDVPSVADSTKMKELELENARLRRIVLELTLAKYGKHSEDSFAS